ncbi:cytidylyltransferase [Cordyceps militaris]|uniref:Cytidylyltransferase n=1 Tax=Cordyceps militaris TaxID=73501 RepID=A0A2H4SB74_CORMI|nr:cytidylyltransferase [Cordyceps militaris]
MPSTDITDSIVAGLAAFRTTSARLQLIRSITRRPNHWGEQWANEHGRVRRPPEGTFAGARPPALQSRLLVLDASFNPPTRAHAYMVTTAVHDVLEEQRAAVAEAERRAAAASSPTPVVRPETGLVLLLAVANADKPAQPASLEDRLAMIYAFLLNVQAELHRAGDNIPIAMALTSEPFFSAKADALRTASWYHTSSHHGTFRKVDEYGRTLPGTLDLPPMEFIVGFDTLVRILDPKYYKEVEEGTDAAENNTEEAGAAADQNDVEMEGASYNGEGNEETTAEETPAAPTPTPPDALAAPPSPRKRPQTPMMKALDPFFEHASLRVMLRPGDGDGEREAQLRCVAGLGGDARDDGDTAGVLSLDEVGGDVAWMRKVHLLSDGGGDGNAAAGVSSSMVRQRVRDHGPLAAQDFVYPLVLDWLKKHELVYQRPHPDDDGSEEISSTDDDHANGRHD